MPDGTLQRRRQAWPDFDQATQVRLARWNRARLCMRGPPADWRAELDDEHAMRAAEFAFIEASRAVQAPLAARAPRDAAAFVDWFEELKTCGPGQGDALFPWLAEHADLEAMRWFVAQEAAGEAGFEDLVAMAQVKAPTQAKLELARNYWDEMGRGGAKGMHGPMLEALIGALGVTARIGETLAPSLALANTMTALATNRVYAYHALGALGAIELTAPTRAVHVSAALKRLKVPAKARHYFDLHAVLDVRHSQAWNREVFASIVAETPHAAPWIAEGALLRLACGAACFDGYRRHLWGGDGQVARA